MSAGIRISGKRFELVSKGGWRFERRPGGWILAEREGAGVPRRVLFVLSEARGKISASLDGVLWRGEVVETEAGGAGAGAHDSDLTAQFPGKVRKILVSDGARVREGDPLVLVEAMKMEFSVRAPSDGRVARILVQEGQQLAPGTRFLDFEAGGPAGEEKK